jgi:hypothetical protein
MKTIYYNYFACSVCGKVSQGRATRGAWGEVGTDRFPRRHKVNGTVCEGCYECAEYKAVDLGDEAALKQVMPALTPAMRRQVNRLRRQHARSTVAY